MLTQKRLKELLHYDPDTGIFRWLRAHRTVKVGDVAGGVDEQGYIRIRVDGRKYRAHRLAWLYVHGVWPRDQLDHRDLDDKANNRMENLREADNTQNNGNRRRQPNNTSGFRGVSWFKPKKCWRAIVAGKYVGSFHSREAAAAAYAQAAKAYFGDFARVG